MDQIKKLVQQLKNYKPRLTKQPDHEAFWQETLERARNQPLNEQSRKINYPIHEIQAYELTYHGYDDTPIHAYYLLPNSVNKKFPCLIFFHGYGSHKQSISDYAKWLIQGYAVITVDCRGQGKTGDYSAYNSDEMGSWVTKGILNKYEYYYRKVYVDGVRAIDFACSRPEIDTERIAVIGASMGGGITLAVCALDHRPKLAVADVPNMCDIELAIQEKIEGSLTYVESYLKRHPSYINRVFETLSYFDNLNLCSQITCDIRVSVGLKDLICPPKSIFGIYNHIQAKKSIEIYPFSAHNVYHVEHVDKTIQFVNDHL